MLNEQEKFALGRTAEEMFMAENVARVTIISGLLESVSMKLTVMNHRGEQGVMLLALPPDFNVPTDDLRKLIGTILPIQLEAEGKDCGKGEGLLIGLSLRDRTCEIKISRYFDGLDEV